MKALVVDDDSINRLILQKILSVYAEVHSCVDGKEAVEKYKTALDRGEPYDLVCMDVRMPVMGGIETLRIIRREDDCSRLRPQATKVIMTTAADDHDTVDLAFRELCDAYIVKPIDAERLIDVVRCLFPIEKLSVLPEAPHAV
ncbi:MAG: response regulator [Bryobacteraceae bacterium]|jgi:two-component system chemotaxis response regulator CheY